MPKTPVYSTSTLTVLRMALPTATQQPSPTPTVDAMLDRPTVEPGTKPTTDPMLLTPVVQPSALSSITAKNVVGISFNDVGDKLIIVQTDGVYFYTVDKMDPVKNYDTSKTRNEPGYLGSTDNFSAAQSPNREWLVLGQWQHYTSAIGNVQRGVISILQAGNGISKIIGLDQNPNTMAAPFINVRYTPDNLQVAGELDSANGLVQVWETKGNLLYTLPALHGLKSLEFSPKGKQLAICAINGDLEIHDSTTGQLISSLGKYTQKITEASCGVTYSHNGSILAYYGDDEVINLWETEGANIIRHLPGTNTTLNQIIFSPDDQSIVTLGSDSWVRVWSIDGHKELFSWLDPKVGIGWVQYSPDGHYLLAGGADGIIRIFDPITKQLTAKIDGKGIAFSQDGKLMASYDANGKVWIWQTISFNAEYALAHPPLPTLTPTQVSTQTLTQSSTPAPTQTFTLTPTQVSTQTPTQALTQAPTQTLTQAPTQTLTQAPTQTLTQAPTQTSTQALVQVSPQTSTPSAEIAMVPSSIPTIIGLKSPQGPLMQGGFIYPFSSLGYYDLVMNGPHSSSQIDFSVPNDWALNRNTVVQLHIKTMFTSPSGLNANELIQAGQSTLTISFNHLLVTTLLLDWNGERTITIPINNRSLIASKDGQHNLTLVLNSDNDCKVQRLTTVMVMADSSLNLEHDMVIPKVNLTKFPSPIYQNNLLSYGNMFAPMTNFVADSGTVPSAVIITSENPTAVEMQAALIVSAGLGRLTGGNLPLITLPVSQLTDQIKKSSHMIFVGKGDGLIALNGIALPVKYDGKSFKTPSARPEDGIIQEAISPWDPSKVILVVSSESDSGLIKAAQAISSGNISVSKQLDLAVISDVSPDNEITSVQDDRTLDDLGYLPVKLIGTGYKTQDYLFYIPPGQTLRELATFKLMFTNSASIDFAQSSLSVTLNGTPIGGIHYSAESAKSLTTADINIPGYLLRLGTNRLTIQADQNTNDYCSNKVVPDLWTDISNQSTLHIPMVPAARGVLNQTTTLANHTGFLLTSPNLDSTAFVVAQHSPTALNVASKIAYQLGSLMTGRIVNLGAAYADQIPDGFKKNKDLVLVGKASQLPIIAELGSNLPVPFDKGSDVAQDTKFRVTYHIPENTSLGYLELLTVPWDTTHNILAVLGTTDEGLTYSGNALTVPTIKSSLGGNFAIVRNEQVLTSDSPR